MNHHILLLLLYIGRRIHQMLKLLFEFLFLLKFFLAVFKELELVQEVPSYSSVALLGDPVGYHHQKLKLLFVYQHLLNLSCCIHRIRLFVQLFPSYSSVAAVTQVEYIPPKPNAAVCIPCNLLNINLAVFIELTDVQVATIIFFSCSCCNWCSTTKS
jgi:hypothetical protein